MFEAEGSPAGGVESEADCARPGCLLFPMNNEELLTHSEPGRDLAIDLQCTVHVPQESAEAQVWRGTRGQSCGW